MRTTKKIILVEDNIADMELTKLAFRKLELPLEVIHVFDGYELIDLLENSNLEDVALILLDLNMPKLGGLEVLKIMDENEELCKLPVIVFSTSSNEEDVYACYEFGANAYVNKPIDINEFHKTIEAIAHFWGDVNVLPAFNNVNL